jgi:hypothetical protein
LDKDDFDMDDDEDEISINALGPDDIDIEMPN